MPAPIVIAVAALVRDGRVLLGHRHPRRRIYPDCWDLVGGHVEAGETPEQAVIRECGEELGVRILDPLPMALNLTDPAIEMHAFVVRR
ncbi:NUDIX hydrolase [Nocardioides sp. B-3]|uniref:NUDIX hydrolase n=1 Tax=Nocardioides sp. B-3 TaxID=2895565 RepID=UPI0021537ECB|nr:NUDIX domain-containing protein [Nocardioides sp. B-3]UUZ59363.1 NUDIX domain-containing protein [Nocardioides sp. B-3]